MKKSRQKILEKDFLQRINQLDNLRNYYIFPSLGCLILGSLFYFQHIICVILLIFFSIRIICTKQKIVIVASFVSMVMLCAFLAYSQFILIEKKTVVKENHEQSVLVNPNHVKVNGDSLTFEGVDQKAKEKKRYYYRLTSEQEKLSWQTLEGYVLLSGDMSESFPEGQRNLKGFDYQKYLADKGINKTITIESVDQIQTIKSKNPLKLLEVLRRKFVCHIDKKLPNTIAMYMKSLLFGVKDVSFQNEREVFESLGVLYFFSISGTHIYFFLSVFQYLFRRIGVSLESIFWLEKLYVGILFVMTGATISVWRSCLQIIVNSVNKRYQWYLSELDCWGITLLISLFVQPVSLFSIGGQFSFFLSFILIYVREHIKNFTGVKKHAVFSVLVSLAALPLTCYYFYEWHLLSGLLSFLLLPFFQYICLPVLSIAFLLSYGEIFASLLQVLEFLFKGWHDILTFLGKLTWLQLILGSYSGLMCVGLLALLLIAVSFLTDKPKRSYQLFSCLVCVVLFQKYIRYEGILAFVDVGQGDSIVIQQPFHGKVVVIDVGGKLAFEKEEWAQKESETSGAQYTLIPFLKSRGINQIDTLFLTHSDEDHMGDLASVAKEIKIKQIIFGEGAEKKELFLAQAKQISHKTNWQSIKAPVQVTIGKLKFAILSPSWEGQGENNDSLVMYLPIKNRSFLLTGDLEESGEEKLVKAYPELPVDVLKVGHHGSKTSTSEELLNHYPFKEAIISCGVDNQFGHPHEAVLDRLDSQEISVYQTNKNGMIYYQWSFFSKKLGEIKTVKSDVASGN